MKTRFFFLLLALCLMTAMSAQRQNIIFETDMGNDVDDALAIDMLYKYDRQKRINLMAVMLNKEGRFPAMYIDLLNTWYGCKHTPIGVTGRREQSIVAGNNFTQVVVEKKDDKGQPLYKRSLRDYDKLLPAPELYRKLLAKAKDRSVTIVSVGFSTNLALLLDSKPDKYSPLSGSELVARKVDRLVVMAGHMEDANYREYNVVNDVASCQKVFRQWPTPIYTSPFEVGLQIKYPARSIENDFGWAAHHPIVDSYKVYLPKIEDRPTWDLTAVLYAIDPQDFFSTSAPGQISITDDGCTRFAPKADGTHHYLSVTPEQAVRIRDYFVEMITAKP